jgi:hypothetical protein
MRWLMRLFSFFFCRKPEQIAISGMTLTESQISRLEARLTTRPGDLLSRYQVLGYMSQLRFIRMTYP